MREDGIFANLQRAIPNWDAKKNAWILEATWRIVDERVSACQDLVKNQSLIQRLGRTIAASLKVERRRSQEEAGAEVDTLLGSDPPLHWEAWHR